MVELNGILWIFIWLAQKILSIVVNSPNDVGFYCALCFWSFLIRYLRLVVNAISFWTFYAIPVPKEPTLFPSDVSVIVPTTLSNPTELARCISSILQSSPAQVYLVVVFSKVQEAKGLCKEHGFDKVKVLSVPKLGKRFQLVKGIKAVETPIVVFADDDVKWPKNYLPHLIAPLETPSIGACGTNQRVIRNEGFDVFNFLGISYLERRNFNTGSTCHIDGGISTLSGRTSCFRTAIVQDEVFYERFQNASWRGKILNSDDDKFLTKWVYSHGWRIHLQFTEEAVLFTSLDSGSKFIHQCLRWARAHWRGNIDVVCTQSYWYKKHVWTCYATYIGSLMTPSLFVDSYILWTLNQALDEYGIATGSHTHQLSLYIFSLWLFFTKIVKLLGHFRRYPQDIVYIPFSIVFAYLHGFLNIYALLTLQVTTWGNKQVSDNKSSSDNLAGLIANPEDSDEVLPPVKIE